MAEASHLPLFTPNEWQGTLAQHPEQVMCQDFHRTHPEHVTRMTAWLSRHPSTYKDLLKRLSQFLFADYNETALAFSNLARQDQVLIYGHDQDITGSETIHPLRHDYFTQELVPGTLEVFHYETQQVPKKVASFVQYGTKLSQVFHQGTRQLVLDHLDDNVSVLGEDNQVLGTYRATTDLTSALGPHGHVHEKELMLSPDERHFVWFSSIREGTTKYLLVVYRLDTTDHQTYTFHRIRSVSPRPDRVFGDYPQFAIDARNRIYMSSQVDRRHHLLARWDPQTDEWWTTPTPTSIHMKSSDDGRYLLMWFDAGDSTYTTTLTDTLTEQRITLPWKYTWHSTIISPDFKFIVQREPQTAYQPTDTYVVRDMLNGKTLHTFTLGWGAETHMITSDYHLIYHLPEEEEEEEDAPKKMSDIYAHPLFPQQQFTSLATLTGKAVQAVNHLVQQWQTAICEVDAILCLGCMNTPLQNITVYEVVQALEQVPHPPRKLKAFRDMIQQVDQWCREVQTPLQQVRTHDVEAIRHYGEEKAWPSPPTGPPELTSSEDWHPVEAPVTEEKQPAPDAPGYDWGRMATPVPYYRGPPGPETAAINRELMKDQPDVAAIAALLDQQGVVGLDTTPQALAQQLVDHRPSSNKRRREI